MHRFRVWGPRAKHVSVVVDGERYAMESEPRGWWSASVEKAHAGSRYGFLLDSNEHPDETPLPDPRSARQPDGVHDLSEVVDHSAFAWSDAEWRPRTLGSSVIYELHLGTFTPEGTLDAAIGRLDHLVSLGVSVVELMPVAAFPGEHGWGYEGIGLGGGHEPYGGPDALKRFVDACHGRGLAVYLDVV